MPSLGLKHSCCPGSSMAVPGTFWLYLWALLLLWSVLGHSFWFISRSMSDNPVLNLNLFVF